MPVWVELPRFQERVRLAEEVFRNVGTKAVADDELFGLELLRGYVDGGQPWVIADHSESPWHTY